MSGIGRRLERLNKLVLKKDTKAVPQLVKALGDTAPAVRAAAAQYLGQLGDRRAVSHLLPLLQDAEPEVRYAAAHALGWLRDERAVPRLIKCLKDSDPQVRLIAVMALGWIGAPSAASGLARALSDPDPNVRQTAAGVLARFGERAPLSRKEWGLVVGSLMDALMSDSREARLLATGVLSRLGDPAIDLLMDNLYDRHGVNGSTGWMLSELGAAIMWTLLDALQHSEDEAQREALTAVLSRVGEPAVPALLRAVMEERTEVRHVAIRTLKLIGAGAVAPLAVAVRSGPSERRAVAAAMLARIGEPARPALVEMARDVDPVVREVAVRTLGEIGGADSIEALAGALYDRDDRVRMEAARALGAAGAGAIPALLEALR
ncbi:MAG TPA: HEAT repeat domain-containing protein, partial [Aggregatilineales bacterium]|nr:HEAT repeat domain-containing protein [Aggregatilineales bacterium]